MNFVFWLLEFLGTISFALSGSLTAIKKEMDIFGACVLGMTTSIGGGVIRDLILGITPPTALVNPSTALIAIVISIITYIPPIQKRVISKHKAYEYVLFLADSAGLGLFTVIGVRTAYQSIENPNLFTAVFLGVLTGVGGGVLRDVFSREVPRIFVKNFYACAAIVGAVVYAGLRNHVPTILSASLVTALVLTLRILAAKYRWELPKPKYHDNSKK